VTAAAILAALVSIVVERGISRPAGRAVSRSPRLRLLRRARIGRA